MKCDLVKSCGSSKLVAFFSGFASDSSILSRAKLPQGFDAVVFCDYRDLNCDFDFSKYSEVFVVAWSFGVRVADMFADRFFAKAKIAVNGSLYPIDAERGIHPEIFKKTAENFSEENKSRFYRRICGSFADFEKNSSLLCALTATELKAELESLGAYFSAMPAKSSAESWTCALASKSDKIFALENMRRAWGGKLRIIDGAHFNLQAFDVAFEIIDREVRKVGGAFERNLDGYDKSALAQREICSRLVGDIKSSVPKDFLDSVSTVLEIGCGTGMFTSALSQILGSANWYLNDLTEKICASAANKIGGHPEIIAGDVLDVELPKNIDMVVSSSCFQWVGDLNALFKKIHSSIKCGGIFAFSTFGGQNYIQIRSLLGKGLEYREMGEIIEILGKTGFSVVHSAEDLRALEFKSPREVLRHIKSTGVNGGFSEFWTPSKLRDFSERYRRAHSCENGVLLTYNPIRIIAKKKF